ncbi:hypothetical protein [Aeromonas salmonicida]|uniref:hypothetical protein n=1 Tax=Aeromonas salmonicida TaxID=645 RepID=UPI0012D9A18E|nr:hypothetical protein [Aeromonas salmonicida]
MKCFTHDADLRGMVVLRSLGFQLVPFKLHRFRKQRPKNTKRREFPPFCCLLFGDARHLDYRCDLFTLQSHPLFIV